MVLVVDDEPDYRAIVRMVVEAQGHTVVEAVNGAAAVEVLEAERVDVVVSDLNMPVMDGAALRDHVAGLSPPPLPFLLWSAAGGAFGGNPDIAPKEPIALDVASLLPVAA